MQLLTDISPTARQFQEQMIAFIRAFGLHRPDQTPCGRSVSVAEAHTLMELTRTAPLTQNDLARRLRLEKSTVSRLVAQLDQRGWITRERNSHDGRALDITLTPEGTDIATDLATARQQIFDDLLQAIPDTKRATVLQALTILTEALYDHHANDS
ncbi:MAG: MarR family transcriptional regulator [Chloroflexi bacterium AL-W]|nr:MarR family transcriptional regulator [Chloroflexi bacterium AL-N1]NOK70888.1 MarR family transcriptional regulator [Chloroflexi bacterium AL-N10]NOK78557.1 MarR family transcriptional regulator [Chloroflexi bacterium AL-N5]NOK85789.1 MarR family transcriptional regulator [Chloroflexi bacterium AL-W]NOK92705.1 MarR family transcriptional regulator [Chloroflexi bacterium AL-N15]